METNTLGQNIKELREKRGLTVEELGARMNVKPEHISDWERDWGGPNGDQMMELVDIFNVSYNEIAGRVNKTYWSLQDILIMAALTLSVVMSFQPLLINQDGTGFSLYNLILNGFGKGSPFELLFFIALLLGANITYLLVQLFLSIQNTKIYQYYGLLYAKVASVTLLLLVLIFAGVVSMNLTLSITGLIFVLSGIAAAALYFIPFKA